MTANKRIFLNIVATYGRSLYALVIGLFCGRWTLMTLGEVDYGLIGVVGGLTAFVTFLNGIMAGGVGRFYAISVGAAQKDPEKGLEECHKWFTTAVIVHTVLPTVLMLIGYPVGEWAVRHFLTIPPDRVQSCVWVWRCVCVTTFVGMVGVPFSAWYGAKQEIAELTVYSFITTTLNVFFMYYAVNHPGDWLVPLAAWQMLLSLVPQLIICFRAGRLYLECRFVWRYVGGALKRVKEMLSYSGWVLLGTLGDIFSAQGISILVNKYFGPSVNAAQNVGGSLSGHCNTLSSSMIGAFWPAIINAYGAGDLDRMRKLVYQICKIGTVCVMVFAIPLALEVDEVLILWLKSPPEFSAGLCLCALAVAIIDKTTYGYAIAVHATGKLARYQSVVASLFITAMPLAWVFFVYGFNVYYAGISLIISRGACAMARLLMARKHTGLSFWYWVWHIGLPLGILFIISIASGFVVTKLMDASFGRICLTTLVCEIVLFMGSWFILFEDEDRKFVVERLKKVVKKI